MNWCYFVEGHPKKCSYEVSLTVTNTATINLGSINVDVGVYNSNPPKPGKKYTVHAAGSYVDITQDAEKYCNGDWGSPSDWTGIVVSWKWNNGVFLSDLVDLAFTCGKCAVYGSSGGK